MICARLSACALVTLARAGVDEGCLVGSSSMALVLVLGESVASGYVPPRPFRVNAGPVHSYVLMADGSTKYLAEVRAGDEVAAVRPDGGARAVTVGRCKVEPRPTLRVDFDFDGPAGGQGGQLFLQQAETVRLAGDASAAPAWTAVTELAAGGRVLVRTAASGTHVGRAISARVEER